MNTETKRPKIEIKRVACPEGYAPTYWEVWLDGQRATCERTFRKAWNQAKRVNPDTASYVLDPLDR